jgi:hypothetical protein
VKLVEKPKEIEELVVQKSEKPEKVAAPKATKTRNQ